MMTHVSRYRLHAVDKIPGEIKRRIKNIFPIVFFIYSLYRSISSVIRQCEENNMSTYSNGGYSIKTDKTLWNFSQVFDNIKYSITVLYNSILRAPLKRAPSSELRSEWGTQYRGYSHSSSSKRLSTPLPRESYYT